MAKSTLRGGLAVAWMALAVAMLIGSSTAVADLLALGSAQFNPDTTLPGINFQTTGPSWFSGFGNGQAGNLDSSIVNTFSVGGQDPFAGTVRSSAFYLNGVDASGGLGFAYQITLTSAPGDLRRVTFDAIHAWQGAQISSIGTIFDSGGISSALSGATFGTWTDGDPISFDRDASSANIGLDFRAFGDLVGTGLNAGQQSSIFFYEATNVHSVSVANMNLIDGGEGTALVLMVPAPGAALLGVMGLGMVGWIKRRFRSEVS